MRCLAGRPTVQLQLQGRGHCQAAAPQTATRTDGSCRLLALAILIVSASTEPPGSLYRATPALVPALIWLRSSSCHVRILSSNNTKYQYIRVRSLQSCTAPACAPRLSLQQTHCNAMGICLGSFHGNAMSLHIPRINDGHGRSNRRSNCHVIGHVHSHGHGYPPDAGAHGLHLHRSHTQRLGSAGFLTALVRNFIVPVHHVAQAISPCQRRFSQRLCTMLHRPHPWDCREPTEPPSRDTGGQPAAHLTCVCGRQFVWSLR
eukprot:359264-Chlamydomonas_euryale.AAC.6